MCAWSELLSTDSLPLRTLQSTSLGSGIGLKEKQPSCLKRKESDLTLLPPMLALCRSWAVPSVRSPSTIQRSCFGQSCPPSSQTGTRRPRPSSPTRGWSQGLWLSLWQRKSHVSCWRLRKEEAVSPLLVSAWEPEAGQMGLALDSCCLLDFGQALSFHAALLMGFDDLIDFDRVSCSSRASTSKVPSSSSLFSDCCCSVFALPLPF